jgi:hypothetical protein
MLMSTGGMPFIGCLGMVSSHFWMAGGVPVIRYLRMVCSHWVSAGGVHASHWMSSDGVLPMDVYRWCRNGLLRERN